MTKFKHPVDVLKDLGVQMTPDAEAKARSLCDEMLSDLERHIVEGEGDGEPVGILASPRFWEGNPDPDLPACTVYPDQPWPRR